MSRTAFPFRIPYWYQLTVTVTLTLKLILHRITFSNINSATAPVDGVLCLEGPVENRDCTSCVVDAHIFTPPADYFRIG